MTVMKDKDQSVALCKACGLLPRTSRRRICEQCERKRHLDWYYKNRASTVERTKRWRKNNPIRARANTLRHCYNLTEEEIKEVSLWSGGPCECCGKELFKFGRGADDACLDHNHKIKTGYRGIICGGCNRALGCVKDSISTLTALIEYLRGRRYYGSAKF